MERQVKGIWIPIEVWENTDLSWPEKILLMEIDSYTGNEQDFFYTNETISKMFGVSDRQARNYVASLIEKGYIESRFDGRHRYLRSRVEINFHAEWKSLSMQGGNILPHIDNNISIDNTCKKNISKDINIEKERCKKEKEFSFAAALWELGVDKQYIADYLAVRKLKKAANTKSALDALVREAKKAGISVADAVIICCEQSWQGFRNEYYQNLLKKNQRNQAQDPVLDVNDRYADHIKKFDWNNE